MRPLLYLASSCGRRFIFSDSHSSLLIVYNRVAEVTTGIICSSLPILPAFFRHIYPKARQRISAYHSGSRVRNGFVKGSQVSSGKVGNENHFGGYLELDELEAMQAMQAKNSVSTAIATNPEEWAEGNSTTGILKTTEILQVGEAV